MNIDSIRNGFIIDHIKPGNGMKIYNLLELEKLTCPVAIITNVSSKKMGKKDIIKIDDNIKLNLDILGYIDSNVTVNVVKDSELIEKKKIDLPRTLTNVIFCKNPRCITTTEQELDHVFDLREDGVYRCAYCETKAN